MYHFDLLNYFYSLKNSLYSRTCQVAQMERAQCRLQSELERCKDSNRAQEDQKESRLQVDQLQEQADRLTAELSSLQTTHNTLRSLLVLSCQHKKLLTHALAIELHTWYSNLVSWQVTK